MLSRYRPNLLCPSVWLADIVVNEREKIKTTMKLDRENKRGKKKRKEKTHQTPFFSMEKLHLWEHSSSLFYNPQSYDTVTNGFLWNVPRKQYVKYHLFGTMYFCGLKDALQQFNFFNSNKLFQIKVHKKLIQTTIIALFPVLHFLWCFGIWWDFSSTKQLSANWLSMKKHLRDPIFLWLYHKLKHVYFLNIAGFQCIFSI